MSRDEEFSDFVVARRSELLRLAHMLTGDPGLAEDLVQTALLRTYQQWDKVSAADSPYAYSRKIVLNTFSRQRRRRRVREELGISVDVATAVDDRTAETDQLRRALRTLGARQRAVIVLRFAEDLSVEQVAQLLGVSVGTVKSQTARALQHLRLSDVLTASEGP